MSDVIYFGPDAPSSKKPRPAPSDTTTSKPKDDFTTPALAPHTLFYLAIIRPHTDTYEIIGPVKRFLHLEEHFMNVVNNSPKAITKMEALRTIVDVWGETEPNHDFAERGFTTFIVEGQRGIYTVLRILRQISQSVTEALPAPVYTVSSHGPLTYSPGSTHSAPGYKGYVAGTSLIGSYVERADAQVVAREAMETMTQDVKGVKVSESWEKGSKGGGMMLAMVPGMKWEVKIVYEDQVHKRAREEAEREAKADVGWRF